MSQGASPIRTSAAEFHPIHADQHAPSKLDQQIRQLAQNVWNAFRPGERVPHAWTELTFDKLVDSGGFTANLIGQLGIQETEAVVLFLENQIQNSGFDDSIKAQLMSQISATTGMERRLSVSGRDSPELEHLTNDSTAQTRAEAHSEAFKEYHGPVASNESLFSASVAVITESKDIEVIREACNELVDSCSNKPKYDDKEIRILFNAVLDSADKYANNEEFSRGVEYLKGQLNNLENLKPEEKKALLKLIAELAYDVKNGTDSFYLNPSIDFSQVSHKKETDPLAINPSKTYTGNYEKVKDVIGKQFWIHTAEEGAQAQFYLGFLKAAANISEPDTESVSKNSKVVYESNGVVMYEVPFDSLDNFLSGSLTDTDFNRDFHALRLAGTESEETFSSGSTDYRTGVRTEIAKHDTKNTDAIERFLLQRYQAYPMALSMKKLHRPDAQLRAIPSRLLPVEIKREGGKCYTTYGKVFAFGKPGEEIETLNYVENVLITDPNTGEKKIRVIDYGTFEPPNDFEKSKSKPEASQGLADAINARKSMFLLTMPADVKL